MLNRSLLALAAPFALGACATLPSDTPATTPHTDTAYTGIVSAADPRAQAAGEAILRAGGSATDAATATMLALNVVEPQSSGIGGGGFMVRGAADGTVESYDGRETAPAGATPDWFLASDGSVPPFEESVKSGLSVGVPGNIALAALAHRTHGQLPWAQLFAPAIKLAREGFAINPRLHESLTQTADRAGWTDAGRALYFTAAGASRPVGDIVIDEALARSFETIAAKGPQAFYSGALAEEIARTVAAETPRQGAMTPGDIAAYEAKRREAICGDYRGYRVCSMGPPTSGGVVVLQMLGALERFDLRAMGVNSPEAWHLFVEAQRLAYADRELYLADSDFVSVPVAGLIDRDYLARRSALIDPGTTMATVRPGMPAGADTALADGDEPVEHGTTHFVVVDAADTMVSYTSTVESAFGSGLMAGGFFLNNELTDFSRSPMVDGRPVANRVEGGKRPRSSMSPVVVYDPDGRPFLAIGAAGGATIPVQTARSIVGVIDFGLSAREALGLPFIMQYGDTLMVEKGSWMEKAMPALRALGHRQIAARTAPVKANAVLRTPHGWQGARDPRLDGKLTLP